MNQKGDIQESLTTHEKYGHDALAPFWAVLLVILCTTGLLTVWADLGAFWKGYVLDMTGPAWNYILFRGLFTGQADNLWTRFFTPVRTSLIFITVCFGIEMLQYFKVYDATYDPLDILAYISILLPLFLIDLKLSVLQKSMSLP